MTRILFDNLACPLDGLPLTRHGNQAVCSSNHSYDFDRKGTINLLPVQFKKSKNPGDSKEMILARERFLNAGFYQPISDHLNQLMAAYHVTTVFDAGCGEGYYTQRAADLFNAAAFVGMDISKDAIHAAAKRSRDIQWIVGTNANIPVISNSIDCILSLFGFPVWQEFNRILKPNGIVITADVGQSHLIELRQVLYPHINEKHSGTEIPEGFTLIQESNLVTHTAALSSDHISDLLVMTPHGYRATQERIATALLTPFPSMTLDVVFKIYSC
jgi:23S rRNA (guanine745-N1)-methyltransferase